MMIKKRGKAVYPISVDKYTDIKPIDPNYEKDQILTDEELEESDTRGIDNDRQT